MDGVYQMSKIWCDDADRIIIAIYVAAVIANLDARKGHYERAWLYSKLS